MKSHTVRTIKEERTLEETVLPKFGEISLPKIDPNFKHEILTAPGGESLKNCFNCGTCTASCPIVRVAGNVFQVRTIMRRALLGLKESVLSSEVLWFCASCHTCAERCPQGVELVDVLTILRNLAVKKGYVPAALKTMAFNITTYGFAFDITEDDEALRDMIGLPPFLKANIEQIAKIVEKTGFSKIYSALED